MPSSPMMVDGIFTPPTRRSSGKPKHKGLGRRQPTRRSSPSRGFGPKRSFSPSPPSPPPSVFSSSSAPNPEPIPSISKFLSGDDVYQQAIRGGKRTLRDFLSQLSRREGEAEVSFEQTKEQMELDRERRLEELKNEFASRGLIHSGLYAGEQGRFQQDFATQQEQLAQAFSQLQADILAEETNFRRNQELEFEAAKQRALARRASRYNIGV